MIASVRHMDETELTAIFKSLPCMRSIKLTVCFWEYITDIRWVVDGNKMWIYVSDIYDTLTRDTMKCLAEWLSKGILQGDFQMDTHLADRIVTETKPNKQKYIQKMRLNDSEVDRLVSSAEDLNEMDLIDDETLCNIDVYWIDTKSKCIGHHSKIFQTIEVNTIFKDKKTPCYVIDYILYCNILTMLGKDYRLYCNRFPNCEKARAYISKYVKQKIDNEISCPTKEEQ